VNVLELFNITGKTALVTGCKRGIGFAMAIALAEAGANIIGVSASLEAERSHLEKEVRGRGRNFHGYSSDFGNRKALYAFIQKVKADFPVIDVLVNNAGTILRKGGVGQLTKALANEWATSGVQVNAIAPGYIATENTEALRNDPVRNPAILSRIPAGRWGTPDDFRGAVVFLASRASDYVNGTVLTVDGGWMGR